MGTSGSYGGSSRTSWSRARDRAAEFLQTDDASPDPAVRSVASALLEEDHGSPPATDAIFLRAVADRGATLGTRFAPHLQGPAGSGGSAGGGGSAGVGRMAS